MAAMLTGTGTISGAQSGLEDAQASQLLMRARLAAAKPDTAAAEAPGKDDAKIEKSSRDFESILLGSWLQGAEQSFAKVPAGDGQDDDDSSKDQFQGIAMQALGTSMAASGGIGIAKMIAEHLRASSGHKSEAKSS